MRALVAGGTGFIGTHIVKYLISRGVQVRVLIRKNSHVHSLDREEIELVDGDIRNVDSLKIWTKDVDWVFSVFGILGQWRVPERKYWEVNREGVKNLLESCIQKNLRQFIHISSAGVLGPLPQGVVADESFPFNPSNVYEKTKCEAEKDIISFGKKHGLPFTIIRPEFVYGPGDTHVLGLFRALKDKRFFLIGNGQSLLHPTYIDDLIRGISLCVKNENAIGQTFLMTGERPLTVADLTRIIAAEFNVDLPKMKIPLLFAHAVSSVLELGGKVSGFEPVLTKSRIKFFTQNRAFSFEKARSQLGYVPQVDFQEGVRRTIRWYRENGYL